MTEYYVKTKNSDILVFETEKGAMNFAEKLGLILSSEFGATLPIHVLDSDGQPLMINGELADSLVYGDAGYTYSDVDTTKHIDTAQLMSDLPSAIAESDLPGNTLLAYGSSGNVDHLIYVENADTLDEIIKNVYTDDDMIIITDRDLKGLGIASERKYNDLEDFASMTRNIIKDLHTV